MTVIGCTGHQNITAATRVSIAAALAAEIARLAAGPLIGVSSLAAGADQAFAFCVLAAGGRLVYVEPADCYRDTLTGPDRAAYDGLLPLAAEIDRLPFREPSEAAYYAAGRLVVDRCDVLLAVWDGRPAEGLGGTADIVRDARAKDKPVLVIWPAGAARG